MSRVALIIIYNHRYDRNIEALERIYRGRFSRIVHLMPFYTGNHPRVIPVYENSYYFQGYIAQAFHAFYDETVTHYLFVADDMIINPAINETNALDVMGLPANHCFISGFHVFRPDSTGFWSRTVLAQEWQMHAPGIQVSAELPSPEEALERFEQRSLQAGPLRFDQLWSTPTTWADWMTKARRDPMFCLRYLWHRLRETRFPLSYPLVGGYSDIVVVTADAIRQFSHYCGVFAATRLFVEHAIPTALVLSARHIAVSEDLKLRGRALWGARELAELNVYGRSLKKLMAEFPRHQLFLHPVKLSYWMQDLDMQTEIALSVVQLQASTGYRNQIADPGVDGDDYCFTSTGNDPYMILPPVGLVPDLPTWIRVDVTVPQRTPVQIYYQTVEAPAFSEPQSVLKVPGPGRHELVWKLDARVNGHFRIDPGSAPGPYRIHSISFRQ